MNAFQKLNYENSLLITVLSDGGFECDGFDLNGITIKL